MASSPDGPTPIKSISRTSSLNLPDIVESAEKCESVHISPSSDERLEPGKNGNSTKLNGNSPSKQIPPSSSHTVEDKHQNKNFQNDIKLLNSNNNGGLFGNQFPLNHDQWVISGENPFFLECCGYTGQVRNFRGHVNLNPNHMKMSNHISVNQLFTPGGGYHPMNPRSTSRNRHFVDLHVNPGETISFDMGDHVQHIPGPSTVRMVSSNPTPPRPMPVAVPPGHMVQQIVDENGILRHIILSPQPPLALGNSYSGTNNYITSHVGGSIPHYLYPNNIYPQVQPHQATFPPHMSNIGAPPGMMHPPQMQQTNGHSSSPGTSDPSYINSYKDERTQRQHFKLKKRLEARQRDTPSQAQSPNHEPTNSITPEPPDSTEPEAKISEQDLLIIDALSSVKPPTISEISSTSALIEWTGVDLNLEPDCDYNLSDLEFNLLCDKIQEAKSKVIYSGNETKFLMSDLKPATSYCVQVQVNLESLCGTPSESIPFKTLSCKPDIPSPPKLSSRTKSSISLKWNAAVDNGAKITAYILECDDGKGTEEFVELFNGLQKQFKAAKLKATTSYKFRLAAVNELGTSDFSSVSCFSTCGSAPSQPSAPTLKEALVHTLSVEWEQRANDDNYTLQMEDERTLHGFLSVYNGSDSAYTCQNLSHKTNYKFRLSASNDEGVGPWSQVVTFSTLPDRPSKPGKPCLKGRAHSTWFKIAWEAPREDGGCPIDEYRLEINNGDGFEPCYTGTEIEHVCDNLAPGKLYSLRVHCIGAGGASEFSEIGVALTSPVIPGKCFPPKLHGKPKAMSVHVKWALPDFDGGTEVHESEIEVIHPDETSRLAYKGPGNDCVIAGLLPGRMYKFRVRAYNKVGAGPWSDMLETLSGAGHPDPPTAVTMAPRSPHTVFVAWSEPFHNGAPITEYRLECRTNDKDYELVYSGASCNTEVKSLTPATMHWLQVQAINSAGAGPFSEPVTCQTPPSSPGAISTANIRTLITSTSISLSWREPNTHGAPVISYNIEVGDSIHTTDGDKTEICISGLTPEGTYKVRLQAINVVGPGPFSSVMKLSTRGLPPVPPILELCSASHNSLRLKWGDGRNPDLKIYTLEMESLQMKRFIPIYQGTGQTFKVAKLQEMTPYNFSIRASNEEGDGPSSEVFTFTTQRALPPAVKAPKVVSVTENACVIEWQAVKAIGDDMLSYKVQVGTKEADFRVFYTGIQTTTSIANLRPGNDYSVRVVAVRHCLDGELPGPFSACTVFSTSAVNERASSGAGRSFLAALRHKWKSMEPLSDEYWAFIILGAFAIMAVIVAMALQRMVT